MSSAKLDALTARAREDLARLSYPARAWVPARMVGGQPVRDVVIVGGGQSGMTIAFGLAREAVQNVEVLDRNPAGAEGVWRRFARMETLRTPKHVIGPDLGVPSLLPQAWYEARFGAGSWDGVEKIPRMLWHDYLLWLRSVLDLPIRNGISVEDIAPVGDDLLEVTTRDARGVAKILTRSVVLASGIEGAGVWTVPDMIAAALPRGLYAHTSEPIDFAALRGRRVAVLGAGASAFDNAAEALAAGAASVDLFARRSRLPAVNPYRWMEFAGFLRHFGELPDALKWRFMRRIFTMNQPPPQPTYDRCAMYDGFRVHLGCPFLSLREGPGGIAIETPKGVVEADFLIVGTGLRVDFAARPELARMAPHVALWGDRFDAPAGEADPVLESFPYLGRDFALQEKVPGSAPWVSRVHCYTFAAMPSLAGSAGISALKFGAERLVRGLTERLFLEDAEAHLAALEAYDEPELNEAAARGETRALAGEDRRC